MNFYFYFYFFPIFIALSSHSFAAFARISMWESRECVCLCDCRRWQIRIVFVVRAAGCRALVRRRARITNEECKRQPKAGGMGKKGGADRIQVKVCWMKVCWRRREESKTKKISFDSRLSIPFNFNTFQINLLHFRRSQGHTCRNS